MKILITGATGFVGTTLVPYLYNNGIDDMCLLVRSKEKAASLFTIHDSYTLVSTTDANWQQQVIDYAPDAVIHLAAYFTGRSDNESIARLIEANITFTTLLLEALRHTACQHFINIGTFTEFMNGAGEYLPNNLYSATKSAEHPIIQYYQTQSSWRWINVVVYSPYGRKNSAKKVIDYLIDAIDADQAVAFSPGMQVLDFIHVDDIADFFLTLIRKFPELTDSYYQFHLGTGEGHTVREVADAIERVSGRKINADWGGRSYAPSDTMYAIAPINKNLSLLGWKARLSLEQGVKILLKDMKRMKQIVILGAGVSGLGAAYKLRQNGQNPIVLEKDETYGGLCGNFTINGFRFDRFVHFSFAKDEQVNNIFMTGVNNEIYRHIPNAYNLYKGLWLKHPAQNNLYPLPQEMKDAVVRDFKSRPTDVDSSQIKNYDQWLRLQFGDYFAEHFPIPYTRKYWMTEAKDLETKWMGSREGSRLYQPSIEEVIQGCNTAETPVTYYSKEMRYPKKGGFKSYLSELHKGQDIRYNQQVTEIDTELKQVKTSDGASYFYDRLISSLPLPVVVSMLTKVPEEVMFAAGQLRCTSGYQVSVGLKSKNIPPYLWWYIYDEGILPARVYSPSLKSPDNVPKGCSSLQMEIYCERGKYTNEELYQRSVQKIIDLDIIKIEDILFTDIRFEPYANVISDHNIYTARKIVRDYLSSIGVETIGRFGEWAYMWSDQSLLSGLNVRI